MPNDPRLQRARAAIRRARLYTWCNRLIRWLPTVFLVSIALLFTVGFFLAIRNEFYGTIVATPIAAVILLSGIAYPIALLLRDALDRGQRPWRFGLRYLVAVMTGSAIWMGLLAFALRHLK